MASKEICPSGKSPGALRAGTKYPVREIPSMAKHWLLHAQSGMGSVLGVDPMDLPKGMELKHLHDSSISGVDHGTILFIC